MPPIQYAALEHRDAVAGPEAALEAAEQRAYLRAAVAALAPRQRAMVVLRYYADCSLEEIATALGCRPGTVRATLHQALRRLRERGAPDVGDETALSMDRDDGGIAHDEG